MTEVIVRHLVATSPGGDVAPCSGVNNKGRGTGGERLLLTYNGNDERQVARRLVAALLSATWHCVVRARLLGNIWRSYVASLLSMHSSPSSSDN